MAAAWLNYALFACASYAVYSGLLVFFTNAYDLKGKAVPTGLVLVAITGLVSIGLVAAVPSFRSHAARLLTAAPAGSGANGRVKLLGALVGLAALMVLTHVCVYEAIIHAPNAGYAQAIINTSALLLAVGMWLFYRQPLDRVALLGVALITVGTVMLKRGSESASEV